MNQTYTAVVKQDAPCWWVFRANVTADSGIVTGVRVNVTGAIPAS